MSEPVEASGPTVDEAIDRALEMLGATDDEVEIQILSEGGAGGMLRRGQEARVRVRLRDERTPDELLEQEEGLLEEELPPAEPELEEQAVAAEDFLRGLIETLGLEAEVRASVSGSAAVAEMAGAEMGLLIGRRGATLEALQDVTRAAVQRRVGRRGWVNLDIEGYRARRRATLERRARTAAARVRRSGRPQALEPMTRFERKIVHDALAEFRGVTTSSEGEEPNRWVVIKPA